MARGDERIEERAAILAEDLYDVGRARAFDDDDVPARDGGHEPHVLGTAADPLEVAAGDREEDHAVGPAERQAAAGHVELTGRGAKRARWKPWGGEAGHRPRAQPPTVSPGAMSGISTPPPTSSRSAAGVPASAGNVPKWLHSTCGALRSRTACAARFGPMV